MSKQASVAGVAATAAAVPALRWSLIDIGVNLTSEMYLGNYHHGRGNDAHAPDVDAVVQRAEAVGVRGMLITGGNLEESLAAVALAKRFQSPGKMQCFATVGCHPTRCGAFLADPNGPDAYFEALSAVIAECSVRRPEGDGVVAAIGECGLDYDRLHFCEAAVQSEFFAKQFALARRFDLPMFFHNRNTRGDFGRMVRAHRSDFREGVVHSFTGSKDELAAMLDLGLYIGINGCSLKTQENLDVAKLVPLNRLLIETDAPYCDIKPTHASQRLLDKVASEGTACLSAQIMAQFPVVKKEKFVMGSMVRSRNEPCALVEVLEVLFALRCDELAQQSEDGVASMEGFARILQRNTEQLFGFRL